MDNYDHEIACPDNRGILNYLWYDHFHDSKIDNISFDHRRGLVTLTLRCCRDIENKWNVLKGDHDARESYIDENIDSFTYILTFKGTRYFHSERIIENNDYINGRFKETAQLKKLAAKNKKALYHFRIQIDDGFTDIIFSDFFIRKKIGRVKYLVNEVICQPIKSLTDDSKKAALDGGDFEQFLAMQNLYKTNGAGLLEIARGNLLLDSEHEDSCLYSAYLLGKIGDNSDVPKLLDLFLNIENYLISKSLYRCNTKLIKQNIMDAIELIRYRNI